MYYRFSDEDELLGEVGYNISTAFEVTFQPTQLFIATWDRVPIYGGAADEV